MLNELVEKINEYLNVGGLFNPELMEHHKVSDLLLECRDALQKANADIEQFRSDLDKSRWDHNNTCLLADFNNEKLTRQFAEYVDRTADDIAAIMAENDQLRTENESLLAANRDVMLHWDVLKADYERLRVALMPFAKEATHWATYDDDEPVVEHFPGYEGEMLVGDLRRAFNVLEEN